MLESYSFVFFLGKVEREEEVRTHCRVEASLAPKVVVGVEFVGEEVC